MHPRSVRHHNDPEEHNEYPGPNYVSYTDAVELGTYKEACNAPDADTWHTTMKSNMDSIYANDTWELVPLPANKKALPCKWVFRYKYVSGTEKPKYKA